MDMALYKSIIIIIIIIIIIMIKRIFCCISWFGHPYLLILYSDAVIGNLYLCRFLGFLLLLLLNSFRLVKNLLMNFFIEGYCVE